MKKKLVIILFLLLIFPIVSAVEFDMKTNFSQGETFIAKISGDFAKPLTSQDISFYRRHMQTSIIPKVVKMNEEFYIYAFLLEKVPDNYSIAIAGESQNFTITDDIADFSVDTGFVVIDKDFFIEVKNLQNYKITISSKFLDEEESIILSAKETKKIEFFVADIEKTSLEIVELSAANLTYLIPTYIFVAEETSNEPEQNQTSENETSEFNPVKIIIPESENITSVSTTKTCEEMTGKICGQGEKCIGDSAYAKDGVCCLGACDEIESDTGWKLIGWGVFIFIILVIWFVWRKYKRVKSKIDLLKTATSSLRR